MLSVLVSLPSPLVAMQYLFYDRFSYCGGHGMTVEGIGDKS